MPENLIEVEKLVFTGPYQLAYEKSQVQLPIRLNSVLVRTDYSLISPGTELALYTGTHINLSNPADTFAKYPFYPGYASVGRIVAVGGGVENLQVNDLVLAHANHSNYNVVPATDHYVIKLADDVSQIHTLFARLAAICMTSILQTKIRVGDPVAVLGMGLVGNLTAQLLSLQGACVIGVDRVGERLKIARDSMVKETILSESNERLRADLIPYQPKVIIEATGVPEMVNVALDVVSKHGQVVLLGSPRGEVTINVYEHVHKKGVSLVGAHETVQGSDGLPTRATLLRYVLHLIERGSLITQPLITQVMPVQKAKEAYEQLLHQKELALGMIFDWANPRG